MWLSSLPPRTLVTPRALSTVGVVRVMVFRSLSSATSHDTATGMRRPLPAKIQWKPPASEHGHFQYERDWSRDSRYDPQRPGDTPWRFLTRRLDHAYELYPIIFLNGLWCVLFVFITYYTFSKIEIWLDRSQELPPYHWARIRDNYWKKPTVLWHPEGKAHDRLPLMERLQDEMEVEAKKRRERLAS